MIASPTKSDVTKLLWETLLKAVCDYGDELEQTRAFAEQAGGFVTISISTLVGKGLLKGRRVRVSLSIDHEDDCS